MTVKNRDLFYRDPLEMEIPNLGVAKVEQPRTEKAWKTLEWELRSFVCEGEYERGLERILDSFVSHLSQPQQPAVWVSGFYGSGKSHLARVLEYLWRNVELPTGETARSIATLPADIEGHLLELSGAGKRAGGLWSAAGTLGAGSSESVRLAFLSVIFDAAGLPEQYAPARFVIWLRQNDLYEQVEASVSAAKKDLRRELRNMYVSPILAQAVLDAAPAFADSTKEVSKTLLAQYPNVKDLNDEEVLDVLEEVLELQSDTAGKHPLTLIILDEMQQYINEDNEKALIVQNLVEGCSARFESRVLFLATGQSALTATPTLQKLNDRFRVEVHLSDTDVEAVVRQVILRKKPDRVAGLSDHLDRVSGEIDRQLGGTRIEAVAADKQILVADYPLLPSRRRFWERALRAIDKAGKAGVLRTQLKIVHEATRAVADEQIGHVVGGDFIYDQQAPGMLMSGVLLKEIDELVRSLRDGSADGALKSRLCAAIFLISQLPREGIGDIGLRATPPFLADLLVEDLESDGADLRKRIPGLLAQLAEAGTVMRIDEEYRLQTEEGAEWTKDFHRRRAEIRDDAGRMTQLRNEWLVRTIDGALGGIKLQQGDSKTPRKVGLHWGEDAPPEGDTDVPVWIQDEWSVTESAVKIGAAQAGDESPVVHVLLPRRDADAIKDALAGWRAAEETVSQRPVPQTDEGRAARSAIETQARAEERRLTELFDDAVSHARVFQAGGNEIAAATLRAGVEEATTRSLDRLFPRFGPADNPNWGKVVAKARDGAPDALAAIGHVGEVLAHPVTKEGLATVSAGGTKGADVQKRLSAAPFGWPKDAINGALLALLAAGHVRAEQDGARVVNVKELPPTQIGKTRFFKEDPPPTAVERMAVRGLLTEAQVHYESSQEGNTIPALLQKLIDLADRASGPPPLPQGPETSHVTELQALAGNQQFRAVAERHDQLRSDLEQWRHAADARSVREVEWQELDRLVRHAEGLEVGPDVGPQIEAIASDRQLLADPDPVRPLIDELTDSLRDGLKQRIETLESRREAALEYLQDSADWTQLSAEAQSTILADVGLGEFTPPDISTDAALLQVLDKTPLRTWDERIKFVEVRSDEARTLAAKELQPKSVALKPPAVTLRPGDDVEAYLGQLRDLIQQHLDAGETVII